MLHHVTLPIIFLISIQQNLRDYIQTTENQIEEHLELFENVLEWCFRCRFSMNLRRIMVAKGLGLILEIKPPCTQRQYEKEPIYNNLLLQLSVKITCNFKKGGRDHRMTAVT